MSFWQTEQYVLLDMASSSSSSSNMPLFSAATPGPDTTSYRGWDSFCRNDAGWTPLGSAGFNSCFLDAVVGVFALCGILFGALALALLLRSEVQKPLFKTWNFYARFVIIAPLLGLTLAQAIAVLRASWYDVSFWSPLALFCSIVMIGAVQYAENWRSRVPNGVVLVYWLLLSIIYLVKTISMPGVQFPQSQVLFPIITTLVIMEFCLEWLIPSLMRPKIVIGEESANPRITADIFSEIFFTWLTPFMVHGYSNVIKEKDLYHLRDKDRSGYNAPRFQESWAVEENRKNPRLWMAVTKAFGIEWLVPLAFETCGRALGLAQPIILQYFIKWVGSRSTSSPEPYAWGITLAAMMLAASAFNTLLQQQSAQRFIESACRVKMALQVQLYQKSIHLSGSAKKDMNVGDIVTRMSSDASKIWMAIRLIPWMFAAPIEFISSMVLLYRFLGWSMLAGVAILILISPMNALVIVFNQKFEKQQMDAKDKRTRLTAEIVENMKSIKLYAWANAYLIKLRGVRNDEELNAIRKQRMLGAAFNILFSLPRYLVAAATFGVYSLVSSKPLTSDVIFPALALFNILNFSLNIFPMLMNIYVQGRVASGRLVQTYTSEQLQQDAVERKPRGDDTKLVTISGAYFSPSSKDEKSLVQIDDFTTSAGELNCIIGQVGSGKSSFVSAILGNLHKTRGTVSVSGRVAYVPQTAWVMNATIKENIIFGRPFNGELYNKTLKNCALLPDLASLPDGDKTEVGEKGISLSGGQKARLSLARAVYSQADVYIMDDCLSAVDEHVSKALVENVIGPNGMLKDTARILATNSTRVLKSADSIYYLQDGIVKEHGSYEKLMSDRGSVYDLVNTLAAQQQQNGDSSGSGSKTPALTIDETGSSSSAGTTSPPPSLATEVADALVQASEVVMATEGSQGAKASQLLAETDDAETAPLLGAGAKTDVTGKDALVAAEEGTIDSLAKRKVEKSEEGQVSWSVYLAYIKAARPLVILVWALAIFAEQTMHLGAGLWIKHWSDVNDATNSNYQTGKNLGIYAAIGFAVCFFDGAESMIGAVVCAISASKTLHERMAQAIFRAPMSFFETTPAGTITNRFSTDINAIDSGLIESLRTVLNNGAYILFTLGVITWTTPFFLVLIIPMALTCRTLQQYYIRTTRELARLDSATKSPIFSHFQESLGGMASIRAYNREEAFANENIGRIDANLRAFLCYTTTNRWVVMRLELIAAVVVGGTALLIVGAIAAGHVTSAGAVGLAIAYTLQVAQNLSFLVRVSVEIESSMVSVERILEYSHLPAEAEDVLPDYRPPQNWPQSGSVDFQNYSVRYREGLPLTLKNINLDIRSGERVGIVGRTGAGKSTLTLALFRLIEPASGHVAIDEINTSNLGLWDVRSNLAIIPQDAAIIQGTMRNNLDPAGKHSDEKLWYALEHAQLKDHVNTMEGNLDAKLDEGGANLSQGQRQLVSLARALLTDSKVLVLDEATSAVDHLTDKLLQDTLRSDLFAKRTIITIAHRINTIVDYNRIVVLDKGEVKEFDTPAELVKKGGLFRDLVQEAGLLGMFEDDN